MSLPRPKLDEDPGSAKSTPLSVSQLTAKIKGTLMDRFPYVCVAGEASNVKYHQNGHIYFTLKDAGASIAAVVWRGRAMHLKFRIEDGKELIVCGPVTVYEVQGKYQIVGERVEPRGTGALQLAFEQLKEKLAKEGLFDERRKRPLPPYPWTVAIVTSPTGAAIADMLRILTTRCPKLRIVLAPARVQGEGAAAEIARAIADVNRWGDADVLIVGRGGGSLEDLWAFNEEILARAIAASKIPVVSAVGHEVDTTIADYVADKRAPTPSGAAELVAPVLAEVEDRLDEDARQLRTALRNRFALARKELEGFAGSWALKEPENLVRNRRLQVDELGERLPGAVRRTAALYRQRLASASDLLVSYAPGRRIPELHARLEAGAGRLTAALRRTLAAQRDALRGKAELLESLSPQRILDRGYSITFRAGTGEVLRSAKKVKRGERLRTRLADGTVESTAD